MGRCKSLESLKLFLWYAVVVELTSHVRLFATPWIAAHQASLSLTISEVCPSSCPRHLWCHPAISSSDTLFSSPQSFPTSGTFPVTQLFTSDDQMFASDDQNNGVSAFTSVLSMSIQGWFPLRSTALISLLSKGLSRVLSSITVWKHQFFGAQSSLWSNSHICTWLLERS